MASVLHAPADVRERWADALLDRLGPVMGVLGVVFVLVVLGEQLAVEGGALATALSVTGWLLWAVFAAELLARAVVAPDTGRFWRRNWWQVLFLVLPFLRIVRVLRVARLLRTGRVVSSAVRSTRSTRALLGSRVGWLAAVTVIVVLSASQLLFAFSGYDRYADALHATALAAVGGEPLGRPGGFARLLEVALALYSVVVFATLAGSLGAYFLGGEERAPERQDATAPRRSSSTTE